MQRLQVQCQLDPPHQPHGEQHGATPFHPVGISVVEQSALYRLPQRPLFLPSRTGGPHLCAFPDGTEADAGFPKTLRTLILSIVTFKHLQVLPP